MATAVVARLVSDTKTVTLPCETKLLVGAANEAGLVRFRVAGFYPDRFVCMSIGDIKQANHLPSTNISYIVLNGMNGRLPPEVRNRVEILADSYNVLAIFVVDSNASILRMLDSLLKGSKKGDITFEIPGVLQTIQSTKVAKQKIDQPPPPPDPSSPPGPPPPNPPPPPDHPFKREPLASMLGRERFEGIFDQCGGEHRKVIAFFRGLGFVENPSDGALYQRCLVVRNRRAKQGVKPGTIAVPSELLDAGLGENLLAALQRYNSAATLLMDLVAQLAKKNEELRGLVAKQSQQLKDLPALLEELGGLRDRAAKARALFG